MISMEAASSLSRCINISGVCPYPWSLTPVTEVHYEGRIPEARGKTGSSLPKSIPHLFRKAQSVHSNMRSSHSDLTSVRVSWVTGLSTGAGGGGAARALSSSFSLLHSSRSCWARLKSLAFAASSWSSVNSFSFIRILASWKNDTIEAIHPLPIQNFEVGIPSRVLRQKTSLVFDGSGSTVIESPCLKHSPTSKRPVRPITTFRHDSKRFSAQFLVTDQLNSPKPENLATL